MTNQQTVLDLIISMSTQQVKQAQIALNNLIKIDNQIVIYLINILQKKYQNWIHVISASYLNSAFCDDLFALTIEQYAALLTTILKDKSINCNHKRIFQRSIAHTLDSCQQKTLKQLRDLVFQLIQQPQLRDTAYLLIGCFCLPNSIDIQHVIYLTRLLLPQTFQTIILNNDPSCLPRIKQYNQILKTWIVVWDRLKKYEAYLEQKIYKKKQTCQSTNLLISIASSQYFSSVILNIQQWAISDSTIFCKQKQLQQLNIFKSQAAQLHHRGLQLSLKIKGGLNIYTATSTILPKIINSLIAIAMDQSLLQLYQCQDLTINILKVLYLYFQSKPELFKDTWKQLITKIIFPLIKPSNKQFDLFNQSPIEFIALFQDSTQQQKYGILKTQACKFLQKLAQKQSLIYSSNYISNFLITYSIDSILNSYKFPIKNIYQIPYIDYNTAILILSMFSFLLDKFQQQIQSIKLVFHPKIVNQFNSYQKAITYLFLAYNYSVVYPNPQQGAFWVQSAFNYNQHPTTKSCINDFLFNIVDQFYSDYFIQQLSNLILTTTQGSILDAISKMIRCNSSKITCQLMLQLLNKVYSRIQLQLKSISSQDIKKTIDIIKLLQIVQSIAIQDLYCMNNIPVKQLIWKHILPFQPFSKLDIIDQVMLIINPLIKQQQFITDQFKPLLNCILQQFTKSSYDDQTIFKILNHYIMKSQSSLIPAIYLHLKNGLLFYLITSPQQLKKSHKRLINATLLLLLQNLLATHGKTLTQDQLTQTGSIMIRFIPQDNQTIDSKIVLSRALNTLLLCHMYLPMPCVWNYINIYTKKQIYSNYDIQVLLTCISTQIFRQNAVQISAQMITIIANAISIFRKKQKLQQNTKLIQQKYKKQQKQQKFKLSKYKQYQIILKYITTPFTNPQPFQTQLTNLLNKLKQSNISAYKNLSQHISQSDTQTICQLCKLSSDNLLQKRTIYHIIKPKQPSNIQQIQIQNNIDHSDNQINSQQQFKRKKKQLKKQKKKISKLQT